MNKTKLNEVLTLSIKSLSVVALLTGTYIASSLYSDTQHSGPSCDIQEMQKWIDSNTKGATIVSIFESKVQHRLGNTTCYGAVKVKKGYKTWTGVVQETNGGDIGYASID